MRRAIAAFFFAVFVLLGAHGEPVQADEPGVKKEVSDSKNDTRGEATEPQRGFNRIGVIKRSISMADGAQRVASERFGAFMDQVDGFFSNAGSNDDAVSTGSWARIRVEGVRGDGKPFELKTSVKVRAVLPETERKLKLLISTEDDDVDTAAGEQELTDLGGSDRNVSLALRFIRSAREDTKVDLDLGLRRRNSRIQFFNRINIRFRKDFGENWRASVGNSYYYYWVTGYENRLSFDLRRKMFAKENVYFRTFTRFDWEEGQNGAVIGHTTGLYWQFGERRALALEGVAGYQTELEDDETERYRGHQFRVRWRHNVGRPWFFYEIWPSVAWPSSTDFERSYGILLRAEVIIGEKLK